MASYDSSEKNFNVSKPKFISAFETSSEVMTLINESDVLPIFNKQKIALRIPENCTRNLMHLAVTNNWLVCIQNGPSGITLIRYSLKQTLPVSEISLKKYLSGYEISKMFLDKTGHHLLISLVPKSPGLSTDFLYVHGDGPKVNRIEKFKDHEINAVAFNSFVGNNTATGPILLGTSGGLIFEIELTSDADKILYRRQIYNLERYITELELLRIPNMNKYFVIVATPDCILTFSDILRTGETSLQTLFTAYNYGKRQPVAIKTSPELKKSVFRLFAHPGARLPLQWAWLCDTRIRGGRVSTDGSDESILMDDNEISLDFSCNKHVSNEEKYHVFPRTIMLTEYHAFIVFSDHIIAKCLLDQKVVYEEYFPEKSGKILDIVRDECTGLFYVYTENNVFCYKINDERRNIWQIFLNKSLYDKAMEYARDNPFHLDIVLTKKADVAFENKEFSLAAQVYAETERTFENVCLKFMNLDDNQPLISYIKKCLKKFETNTQYSQALIIWLVNLFITRINSPNASDTERACWQKNFDEIMKDKQVVKCTYVNRAVIQTLFAQHADSYNLSQFAIANGDFEEVINQHLNLKNYSEALQTLGQQSNTDLYYRYCPILIKYLPNETILLLKSKERCLNLEKLVPTLVATDNPLQIDMIIKYLKYCVHNLGETNQAAHNYLLRLYAEHKAPEVITYLQTEGHDINQVHYDINYALAVCMKNDIKVACIYLQNILGMWFVAVDLALEFDLQLAEETANKPPTVGTKRKLWLQIAKHEIGGTNDVKKALKLMEDSKLLRIEDLLPFFSDFEHIDDFKEPIYKALQAYNKKTGTEEYIKLSENVGNDLQNIRKRVIHLEARDFCSICESHLLIRPFFVFYCGHKFHTDCLEKQLNPMLSTENSRKLTVLKQKLELMLTQTIKISGNNQKHKFQRNELKNEIERILASDCLYCGIVIDAVDKQLVEYLDEANADWE